MSYIGRITGRISGRMGGARAAPALIPAGRVASPLANSDQRLHLIGTDGLGYGQGRGGIDGDGDPFADADPFAGATSPGAAAGAEGPRVQATADQSVVPSQAASRGIGPWTAATTGQQQTAAAHGGAPATSRAFAAPSSVGRVESVSGARDPVQASVAPRSTQSSDDAPSALSGSDAAKSRALARPASTLAPVEAKPREPGRPPAGSAGQDDKMEGALADALRKVSRWIGSEPRERPAARAPQAPDGSQPRFEAARVSASRGAARGGDGSSWVSAAAGLQSVLARPRLSVGRIDVQVVAPPAPAAPPASAPASARPARSAPPAPSSGPSPAAYLSFGLRQR